MFRGPEIKENILPPRVNNWTDRKFTEPGKLSLKINLIQRCDQRDLLTTDLILFLKQLSNEAINIRFCFRPTHQPLIYPQYHIHYCVATWNTLHLSPLISKHHDVKDQPQLSFLELQKAIERQKGIIEIIKMYMYP